MKLNESNLLTLDARQFALDTRLAESELMFRGKRMWRVASVGAESQFRDIVMKSRPQHVFAGMIINVYFETTSSKMKD